MEDVILLDSSLKVTSFNQKDHVAKIFISECDHCAYASGIGMLCIHLRCRIAGVKCDHALDKYFMSKILYLADVTDSHRVTTHTRIDDEF